MKASYCAIAAIFSLIAFTFVSCDSGTDDGGQTAKILIFQLRKVPVMLHS